MLQGTAENDHYYCRFKEGDERALAYIYAQAYRPLLAYGKRLLADDFAVSCIVQEAFMKAWDLRARMESLRHLYCFMRLNVNWGCLQWYRHPQNQFHRTRVYYTDAVEKHETGSVLRRREADELSGHFDEERLQLVERVMPYLRPDQQTVLDLYFRYGFSCRQIAHRYGSTCQGIGRELERSLEHLRQVIHVQKKACSPAAPRKAVVLEPDQSSMDEEMETIFRLRYESRLSFEAIARRLNRSQAYVQQQYVEAHRRLRALEKKTKQPVHAS